MITLIIKNDFVVAHGPIDADWSWCDDTYEVVEWSGDASFLEPPSKGEPGDWPTEPALPIKDPRTQAQKDADAKKQYQKFRRRAYPSPEEALQMLRRDLINETTEFLDAMNQVDLAYPEE